MRQFLLLLLLSGSLSIPVFAQSVAVNTDGSTANSSALLDVKSTAKGILIPRLTQLQRDAVVNPATSLMIYQTDNDPGYYFNSGTPGSPNWIKMLQGNDKFWQASSDHIYNINAGRVGIGTSDPKSRLHVVTDSAVLFSTDGDINFVPGTTPVNGQGRRMMWYPWRAAFRAGYVLNNAWNDNLIGNYSVAMGYNPEASGFASIALGPAAKARGMNSLAFGSDALAQGEGTFAAGHTVAAFGNYSSAFGHNSSANGTSSVVFGESNTTGAEYAVAFGYNNQVTGTGSFTAGRQNMVPGLYAFATGFQSKAMADYSFSAGNMVTAGGTGSVAIGQGAITSGNYSVAIGNNVRTNGKASFALGENINLANNSGNYSVAIGYECNASGVNSFVMGEVSNASGSYSVARGNIATASGSYSYACGLRSEAIGNYSFAYGPNAIAGGYATFAFGDNSNASGLYTMAIGPSTASGTSSFANGFSAVASGDFSFGMGLSASASGAHSFSMGSSSSASGTNSVSIGSSTIANADYAVAMGESVTASGIGSFSKGISSTASGSYASAFGEGSVAKARSGFTVGSFTDATDSPNPNTSASTDRIFQVGNGTNVTGANAMTILRNGNTGIGTVLPTSPLQFSNNLGRKITLYEGASNSHYGFGIQGGQLQMYTDAAAAKISFGYYTGGTFTERMWLNNTSGVLTVAATAYPSDERFKKDIRPLDQPLQKLVSLDGVEYRMRTDEFPGMHFSSDKQVGLLAQQVEKVMPSAVYTINEQGYKGVDYAKLVPLLIESIKAQQQQIDELKRKMEEKEK